MKKISVAFSIFLCIVLFTVNDAKAQNPQNPGPLSSMNAVQTGTIISLDQNSRSGLIRDDQTGEVKEFLYVGLEVLEVNVDYVYIVQITVSGRVIIREIHRK